MTQEEKNLLLKYLCAALPYKVICKLTLSERVAMLYSMTITTNVEFNRPYLHPMSSMTEEERKEWKNTYLSDGIKVKALFGDINNSIVKSHVNSINWLLEHHFDFLGLIDKGLAIEVTEDNNPYKD